MHKSYIKEQEDKIHHYVPNTKSSQCYPWYSVEEGKIEGEDPYYIDRKEEDKAVIVFQKTSSIPTFEKLYKDRIPTLVFWSKKYAYLMDNSVEDMFGELSSCFVKAVNRYDKNRGSFNTCLYTFILNFIRNVKVGKKAKKRKPYGSDPNTITNFVISLDFKYKSGKGGDGSTLQDILSDELHEKHDHAEKIALNDTLNIMSNGCSKVKGLLKKLSDGCTLAAVLKEAKTINGKIILNKSQRKKLAKEGGHKRMVVDLIKKQVNNSFKLTDYCLKTPAKLYYTIEMKSTEESLLFLKNVRRLRKNREDILDRVEGK